MKKISRTCNDVVHVHGKSGKGGGGAVISLKGWRKCSGIIEGVGVFRKYCKRGI